MTPVEERIDHAEAKRIAEEGVEWCRDFKDGQFTPAHTQDGWTVEMHGLVDSHAKLSAFVLALLTEHSARDADIYLLVSWVRARLVSRLPSELSEAADRLHAQLALPATESAQPEEERCPNPTDTMWHGMSRTVPCALIARHAGPCKPLPMDETGSVLFHPPHA